MPSFSALQCLLRKPQLLPMEMEGTENQSQHRVIVKFNWVTIFIARFW